MNLTSAFFTPPNFLGGSTSDATKGLGYQYSFSADTAHYKFLSFPLSTQETIGVVLISLMNMLANAGGIGGGGIMIPFMMIFLKLPIEVCIPLANSFALISSITRFVINYNQPHPYRPWRKIIDYEVVTLTMPMVYLGTMLGVQISAYMSQLLLVLLLQAVLIYTLYKTTQKGIQIWIKENQKKQGHLPLIQAEERKREIKRSRYTTSISRIRNAEPSEELKKITAAEGTHFTKSRILKIVSTFGVLFVCLFLIDRANEGKVSSSAVWNDVVKVLSFLFFVTFCILETLLSAKEIRQIHFIKRRDQYEFDENDIHFDKKYTAGFLISMCFLAGMLSGILGIAGGTIMSPLFLSLGMLPSVTAATNQYIGMVSSLSVTLQFMFKDKLNYGYLLFMGIFIFLSALLGLKQVNRLVKKTGRQSIIVFIISFVLFTSFMILPFKYAVQED
ncbi:hypothetical protein FGO68_gene11049 [Halteria grandinella]|uniref:Uncharacterized protein n=1 Tax=Halteria grandinella TaxID=5974 RepID=A0A8J8NQ63_HALGN|nr:hypothetical protein FGO68_gene11049 [Halteria grandinella]